MSWFVAAGLIMEIIQEVRGTAAMLMFIMEEAIQTSMMATYLAYKEGRYDDVLELVEFVKKYLADELVGVSEHPLGKAAYPLDEAYYSFAQATLKSLDTYKKLAFAKKYKY